MPGRMRNRLWPMAAALAFALLPTLTQGAPPKGIEYELFIDCPQLEVTTGLDLNDVRCPVRAIDEQDIMGSPSVSVDPLDPNNLILASLHGQDADGPTNRSRQGQAFTTFLSRNHGASWADNPFYPPNQARVKNGFGEHPQSAIDRFGHVYIGSLYSKQIREQPREYQFTIVAQKFETMDRTDDFQNGRHNGQYLEPVYEGNVIEQFWFVYDRHTDNMTIIWNEHPPGASRQTIPSSPLALGGPKADRLAPDGPIDNETPRPVIGIAWTAPNPKAEWTYAPIESNVGPCVTTTNPVISEGWIYVGCMYEPNKGNAWNPKPLNYTIDLYRFKPYNYTPEWLGSAPVAGGSPKLGVRSDGRIALMSVAPNVDGGTRIVAAFGQVRGHLQGIDWDGVKHYTADVGKPRPGLRVVEANIQDMVYREQSGAVHLILKEWVRPANVLSISLDNPLAAVQPPYVKRLVAVDERYGVLAQVNLDVGNRLNRTDLPSDPNEPDAVFNDLTDDLVQLPPGTYAYKDLDLGNDYQREFFAAGDFGTVIFAEVIEHTNLRVPGAPPPEPPAPPLAAPAQSLSASTVVIMVTGGALAATFAASLALSLRRTAAAAVTRGGK